MLRRDIRPSELADRAEAVDGAFDELWIVEDLPYAGGIAQLGHVLAATEHARIGHGIAPTPFRNSAALAMEWAALADMYPGRLIAGLGHGVQDWMGQIGGAVESPLTLLRETLQAVRGLLSGAKVTTNGRYVNLNQVELKFPPTEVPPVLAGVTGPRSLRLAGAKADGTILPEGHGPEEIINARLRIDQGRAEADRTDHHHLTVFAAFYVGSPGELGPPPEGSSGPSWLAMSTDVEEVSASLHTIITAGADSLILVPIGPSPHYQLEIAASQIVPDLRNMLD